MKKRISLILLVAFCLQLTGYSQKKNFTYRQVYGNERPELRQSLPQITGWYDNDNYLLVKTENGKRKLVKVEAVTGKEAVYLDYSALSEKLDEGLDLFNNVASTTDFQHFILMNDNDLYYFNTVSGNIKQITFSEAEEKNPEFSPDNKKLAYTRENDLYVVELASGKETRLTNDGSDLVLNGYASWVYYEEILGRSSRYRAYWWSPDASMIAYLRFDDSPVPEFPIFYADGAHGSLETTHYPKAGDPNPLVRLGIAHITTGKTVWVDTNEDEDRYVAWPFWTADSKELVYQYMNRNQDEITFFASNTETGTVRTVYSETQKSWVEFFEDVYVLDSGKGFILRSDKTGWRNLYHYDLQGKMLKQITNFDWRVTGISTVNEKTGTIYFTGTGGISTENHLFSIGLDGKKFKKLTKVPGTHRPFVSPEGKYFYDTYSNYETPAKMGLFKTDGKAVKMLGDSKLPAMDEYNWGKTEMFTVPTEDGYKLPAMWILPPDFDQNKKYPVLFTIYGGPNAPSVRNSFRRSLGADYMAQNGIITFIVDHRSTGHFGKKGVELMHRNLGKWEMHDYIEAVKWLRGKSFVDADKIGITGSSYGGYMTCMALTKGAGYFTHGVAGSSVTDWHLYDNVYTERYMDTPEQNPEGYKNGSVFTWADRLEGKLFITHGTIDDNVHMQNTIQLIDLLEDLYKEFELHLYPNQRHGIRGLKRNHLSREQVKFWFKHFLDRELDTEE